MADSGSRSLGLTIAGLVAIAATVGCVHVLSDVAPAAGPHTVLITLLVGLSSTALAYGTERRRLARGQETKITKPVAMSLSGIGYFIFVLLGKTPSLTSYVLSSSSGLIAGTLVAAAFDYVDREHAQRTSGEND